MTVDTGTASGSMPQMTTPSLVGETIDNRYRLMKKLGEGGMGEVYAADHIHIEKKFAIKLLRPEIVSNQEAVTRFRQEARSSSSIGHRNIIAIEDFGQLPDGRIYMAMELLNGAPLNDLIMQPLSPDRLLNILIQTGHGLAAAHSKNIVHRDMKPENIFVTIAPDGSDIPKILDFGIAKVSGNDGQNHLTRTGTIFGTPFYMAPEQALGNPVDQRTDIYAMGVIAYEVFAGSLPFQGESFMGILTQHITTEPEPVQQRAAKVGRTLPPGLAEIISRCLRKNPAERFQTMDELVNALIAIYRQIAGAGMSTYMEAFGGQPGAPGMHPTPMPTGGQQIPQRNPTYPTGPNPQVPQSGPLNAPTQPPYNAPGTGPHGQVGPYPTGPTPIVSPHQPKKSGAMIPIIIALVVVLLGGAGAAVYFLVLAPKDNDGPVAKNDKDKPDKDDKDKPVGSDSDKPIVKDSVDAGAKDVVIDAAGSATVATDAAEAGSDAGSGSNVLATDAGVVEIDAGSAAPPPVEELQVAIGANTKIELFEDGKKVTEGPDTLQMIKVPANTTRTFVVKAPGFKDEKLVVDGKNAKVKVSMKLIPKPPDPHPPDPNHNGSGDHNPLHNPDVLDCRVSVKNPHDKACVKQYCALHPKDDNCTLL